MARSAAPSMPMRIESMLKGDEPLFSFEFFPPRDENGTRRLFATIEALHELRPNFVSVTYGAGGSERSRTMELLGLIRRQTDLEPMAHLTCIGHTKAELLRIIADICDLGVENFLALRGDIPLDVGASVSSEIPNAVALAQLIKAHCDASVGAACYPETHSDATSADEELAYTKQKIAAGAGFLITQLFFDNRYYFNFMRRARAAGIHVPIIPGIMPITDVGQIDRLLSRMRTTIPPKLRHALESRREDANATLQFGVAWATLQCSELLARGAPGIHFYTLNRSPATRAILNALQIARPWEKAANSQPMAG